MDVLDYYCTMGGVKTLGDYMLNKFIANMVLWIKRDYREWPLRFCVELLAWFMSIGANVLFATTVPHVPFIVYLSITVTGCMMYAWSAYTRKSFGMLANYLLLVMVDGSGLMSIL